MPDLITPMLFYYLAISRFPHDPSKGQQVPIAAGTCANVVRTETVVGVKILLEPMSHKNTHRHGKIEDSLKSLKLDLTYTAGSKIHLKINEYILTFNVQNFVARI